jgi:MoaA/NifB/PqqE/SkfB family radical SAM enzyme
VDSPEQLLDDPALRRLLHAQVAGREQGGLLRSLKVKLLSTCNLRCTMCDYWRIPRRRLEREVACRLLDDAAVLGCRKVHLSGGEVTLYPDLVSVIDHAVMKGLRVNLTTNGVLLDRPTARAWIDAGLHAVSVSLDGSCAATHDAIRGVAGAFDQAVKGIRSLRRECQRRGSRLRLRINTVLQRRNLSEMPALLRLAVELGACDVVPMPVDGASADRPVLDDILRYNARVAPEVADVRRKFGLPATLERIFPLGRTRDEIALAARGHYALGHYDRHLCYAPWLHAFVSHHGDVFACCMTNERMPPLGNVHETSLKEIFRGAAYDRFRREMTVRRLAMCSHCDQFLPENRLMDDRLGPPGLGASVPPIPAAGQRRRALPLALPAVPSSHPEAP